MLRQVVPTVLKRWLRRRFANWFRAELANTLPHYLAEEMADGRPGRLRRSVLGVLNGLVPEALPGWQGYFPHEPAAAAAVVPREPAAAPTDPQTGLPLPPPGLWAGYGGTDVSVYLRGKDDVARMRELSAHSGLRLEEAGRVLDFGCSAGRMIRWLHDLADRCEVWGADVSAAHIRWCQQHLSPPFHFAVTTTHPHLPFEDRYFGFVYAGSVFTHLDELADAWFLELRRVLRPGGRLYVTVNDRTSIDILKREPGQPLAQYLAGRPEYAAHRDGDFGMLSVKGPDWTGVYVFYDLAYLCRRLRPLFRTLSASPAAYGYQTGLLLERA